MADVKKRRLNKKDWDFVQQFVTNEKEQREKSAFRKRAEDIWREVDRQVNLESKTPIKRSDPGQEEDWHNEIELGELSKASEIQSADFRRITFPNSRFWFDPHSELEGEINQETGEVVVSEKVQSRMDGALRAMMTQQHKDFQFKTRIGLSVKEALHHGSFAVEVREESQMRVHKGTGIESMSAPVWHPYSMWNTYPDPSPSVITGGLFYTGSMIFVDYIPKHRLKPGKGWFNLDKIPDLDNKVKGRNVKDVMLVKYYGDLEIKRGSESILLLNSKVIVANGMIEFYLPSETPFSPVIYSGYEKLDIRDPYHVSPIMKLSPMQTMGSQMGNKGMDAVDLKTEPPMIYSSNDPYLVQSGGPVIAPGAKTATKSLAEHKMIETGDPSFAFEAMQFAIKQINEGTAADAIRSGGDSADKTAFEVRKRTQGGEIRIVDFIDKFETEALMPFLYMQHELNKQSLKNYPFYNPEFDAPNFERASKGDLPKTVHFEIVGSKGILGEEERTEKTNLVTEFIENKWPGLVDKMYVAKQAYQDAGNKNPERFLGIKSKDDETQIQIEQVKQEAQQQMEELQKNLEELDQKDKKHEIEKELFKVKLAASEAQVQTMEEQLQIQDKVKEHDNVIVQEERVKASNIVLLDEINDKLKELDERDNEGVK